MGSTSSQSSCLCRNANTPDAHCTSEKRSTTLEPYFGWVEHAKFEGKKEIRHKEYDFWTLNVTPHVCGSDMIFHAPLLYKYYR